MSEMQTALSRIFTLVTDSISNDTFFFCIWFVFLSVCLFVGFYGISTFVGYLTANLFLCE